jgi:hypothetical protein
MNRIDLKKWKLLKYLIFQKSSVEKRMSGAFENIKSPNRKKTYK